MNRVSARWAILSAAVLVILAGRAGESLAQGPETPGAGSLAQQVAAGDALYAIHCAMCHGTSLAGTVEVPPLTGRFVAHWAGRPLGDLFSYLAAAMPQHAPGSLSPEQNAQILAFLLHKNGVPVRPRLLPSTRAQLDRIPFDAPGE